MKVQVGPKGLHPEVSLILEIKNKFFQTKFFIIVVSLCQPLVGKNGLIN